MGFYSSQMTTMSMGLDIDICTLFRYCRINGHIWEKTNFVESADLPGAKVYWTTHFFWRNSERSVFSSVQKDVLSFPVLCEWGKLVN